MEQKCFDRWFSSLLLLILGLGLFLEGAARASDLFPVRIGLLETSQAAEGCAILGNYGYVVAGKAGLLVVDISDPSQLKQVSAHATEHDAVALSLGDGIACVSQRYGGVEIVDIRDPQHPSKLGTIPDYSSDVRSFVRGSLAYIVERGLSIFDLSDPAKPKRLGTYAYPTDGEDQSLARLMSVTVEGSFAFCAGNVGLAVFDVKDPVHPDKVAEVPSEDGEGVGIVVAGHYAYLAAQWGDLQVFDISDPYHPVWVSAVDTLGMASTVCMWNGHLVVGAADGIVSVFDLSEGNDPRCIGVYEGSSGVAGVSAVGNIGLVAQGAAGLASVQFSPANVLIAEESGADAGPLAVSSGLAAIGSEGRIRILDVLNPHRIRMIGELATGMGRPDNLQLFGSYACYINWHGDINDGGFFRTIDISDPSHPRRLGSFSPNCLVYDLVVEDGVAYLAADSCGLQILDLSDPASPQLAGEATTDGAVRALVVAKGIAYLAAGKAGLELVDVRDARSPSRLGNLVLGGEARLIATAASHVYVDLGGGTLGVVNAVNPSQPKRVGNYAVSRYLHQILVSDDHLYLLSSTGAIEVLDIGDPANPRRIGGNAACRSGAAHLAESMGTVWMSGLGTQLVAPLDALRTMLSDFERSGLGNEFGLWIYGAPGARVELERSTDLQHWNPWRTVGLGNAPLRVVPKANYRVEFYRAIPGPAPLY